MNSTARVESPKPLAATMAAAMLAASVMSPASAQQLTPRQQAIAPKP